MFLKLWSKKEAFMRSNDGATMIEYALIAAGVAVAIAAVVFTFGNDIAGIFKNMTGDAAATDAAGQ